MKNPELRGATGFTDAEKALGNRLIEEGNLDRAGLARAEKLLANGSGRLPQLLTGLGLVQEADLAVALADEIGARLIDDGDMPPAPVLEDALSARFLRRANMLPLENLPDRLRLAVSDPFDKESIDAVQLAGCKPIELAISTPSKISRVIENLYFPEELDGNLDTFSTDFDADIGDDIERLKGMASEAPVIRIVNGRIDLAVEYRASDIHIEPEEARLVVRFRVDGLLREHDPPPPDMAAAIVSRIKIMARLDIAERRLPQDGRVQTVVRGRLIDLRISTMPTLHGESVVIRVLDRDSVDLDFDALGIIGTSLAQINAMLDSPNGIILVTGPTGSGKTTSLYAALAQLNTPEKNILTVEDPVEYRLKGIKQVQVNPLIGLDFARVLRSVMRHDPDIVLIGEIRDRETAEIAVQAALTGHLVLSTLHTNDAVSSVTRLLDMGVADYLLGSTLVGVVAQRLVRTLCEDCRKAEPLTPDILRRLGDAGRHLNGSNTHFRSTGCPSCNMSGYLGRTCITECLTITDPFRKLILGRYEAAGLKDEARRAGMRTMFEDGIGKVVSGITSLEEVMRVTMESRG